MLLLLLPLIGWHCPNPTHGVAEQPKLDGPLSSDRQMSIQTTIPFGDTVAIDSALKTLEQKYVWQQKPDHTVTVLQKAIQSGSILNYRKGLARSYSLMASVYLFQHQSDSALYYFKLTLPYIKSHAPACAREGIQVLMGATYFGQGQYDSAFHYAYIALDSIKTHPIDATGYANAYLVYKTVGAMWFNSGEDTSALYYTNKAEQYALLLKDSSTLMEVRSTQAAHYFKKNWDSAIALHHEILTNHHTEPAVRFYSLYGLSIIYSLGRVIPDSALYYAQSLQDYWGKIKSKDANKNAIVYYALGRAYWVKAEETQDQQDYRKAGALLLNVANDPSHTLLDQLTLVNLHRLLGTILIKQQNYPLAYLHSERANEIRDSAYQTEKLIQRGKMDALYRLSEKDKLLAQNKSLLLEHEQKISRRNNLILLISALFVLLISWAYFYLRQKNHKLQNRQALERLQAKLEGEEQERHRMAHDLHDSVNSRLAAAQSYLLALGQEYPTLHHVPEYGIARQVLTDTSQEVRNIAHNLLPGDLTLNGLPIAVKDFCTNLFTPRGIEVDIQVFGTFDQVPITLSMQLYRIIQELTHNIVKHAHARSVILILGNTQEELSLVVEDDGIGMQAGSHKGIGLENLKERIKASNGQLHIETRAGKGTTIHITIPLQLRYRETNAFVT